MSTQMKLFENNDRQKSRLEQTIEQENKKFCELRPDEQLVYRQAIDKFNKSRTSKLEKSESMKKTLSVQYANHAVYMYNKYQKPKMVFGTHRTKFSEYDRRYK